jgi:predicted phage tail protein
MAVTKNVERSEGILRVVIGAFLIVFGFFLTGFWKPLSVVVGGLLVLTAVVGY